MALPSAALEIGSLRHRLAGVSVVTVTPFRAAGVDLEGVARNARRLADAGVRVIVCGGNTGEFYALSPEELRSIVAATVEAVPDDVLIVASAGYRPEQAVRLGAEGLEVGAKAIMLHYPPHPYIGEAGLGRYYELIAAATRAPLILYARGADFTESVARDSV